MDETETPVLVISRHEDRGARIAAVQRRREHFAIASDHRAAVAAGHVAKLGQSRGEVEDELPIVGGGRADSHVLRLARFRLALVVMASCCGTRARLYNLHG
jgi:hypothetical protein